VKTNDVNVNRYLKCLQFHLLDDDDDDDDYDDDVLDMTTRFSM